MMDGNISEIKISNLPERQKKIKKHIKQDNVWAWVFSLMPLVGFMLFSIFPITIALAAAFTDMDIYAFSNISWNFYEGFKLVFDAEYSAAQTVDVHAFFLKSITVTLWIGSSLFVTLLIAFIISICLAQKLKFSKFLQILFFLPNIISSVAIAIMWNWIYDGDNGILNTVLGVNISWLDDPSVIPWAIILVIIWQAPAYGIVMYKAALSNIDNSLYEAADLDGANLLQKTIKITLPSVAPTTFFLMMSSIGAGLLVYDLPALLVTDDFGVAGVGGTKHSALTVMRLIYYLMDSQTLADRYSYMSAAAIISWMLFIVTAGLSVFVYKIRQRRMEG